MTILAWIWLGLGIALIVLEVVIPGLVSVFFGMAAVILSVAIFLGAPIPLSLQIMGWIVLSGVLILTLRKQVAKIFPALEYRGEISDQKEITGQWVQVIEDVYPDNDRGRVRYQGSTWIARSQGQVLRAGSDAYIVDRKNLTLVIDQEPSGRKV